jgi:hypothetical protein
MMFFVPFSDLGDEAEIEWREARARLQRIGLPTTRRRIAAVANPGGGSEFILHVGMPNPGLRRGRADDLRIQRPRSLLSLHAVKRLEGEGAIHARQRPRL